MDKTQQEIKDFHKKIKPELEKVLAQYVKRHTQKNYLTIIRPCRKLIQKCSFKSTSDTNSLCSLAYWLYAYGHKELALEICEQASGVDFEIEDDHSDILNIYGLHIRIARELLGENRRDIITPELAAHYFSKVVKKESRYPQILREEKIASCNSRCLESELLHALQNMIGKGETGLYSELNENWENIEETITEYLDCFEKEE